MRRDVRRYSRPQSGPYRSASMEKVRVGLIGSGFISDLHAAAFKMLPDAELVAVASPTAGKAARFAHERSIPHAFEDYRHLLDRQDIDVVTVALPNHLH